MPGKGATPVPRHITVCVHRSRRNCTRPFRSRHGAGGADSLSSQRTRAFAMVSPAISSRCLASPAWRAEPSVNRVPVDSRAERARCRDMPDPIRPHGPTSQRRCSTDRASPRLAQCSPPRSGTVLADNACLLEELPELSWISFLKRKRSNHHPQSGPAPLCGADPGCALARQGLAPPSSHNGAMHICVEM